MVSRSRIDFLSLAGSIAMFLLASSLLLASDYLRPLDLDIVTTWGDLEI